MQNKDFNFFIFYTVKSRLIEFNLIKVGEHLLRIMLPEIMSFMFWKVQKCFKLWYTYIHLILKAVCLKLFKKKNKVFWFQQSKKTESYKDERKSSISICCIVPVRLRLLAIVNYRFRVFCNTDQYFKEKDCGVWVKYFLSLKTKLKSSTT